MKALGRETAVALDDEDREAVVGHTRVRLAGFDWNCPQHIPPRFSVAEVEAATRAMMARIEELEAALAQRGG